MQVQDYIQYDALGLAELIRHKEISPHEALQAALTRFAQVNPGLNAVVDVFVELAQTQIKHSNPDSPLFGVPCLLKDLDFPLANTRATQGSRLFAKQVAQHSSELVTRLQAAGLIIFGKTNSPEFGLSYATESQLYGACRNPWDSNRTSGGSSGGSAAAVAAGIAPVASGNDGGGSLRIPAACCGLFALKPTRGKMPCGPGIARKPGQV